MNVTSARVHGAGRGAAFVLVVMAVACVASAVCRGQTEADRLLAEYFEAETEKLADRCLADVETLEQWQKRRPEYRRQLLEMLGLDPFPEKTPLKAVVTVTGV